MAGKQKSAKTATSEPKSSAEKSPSKNSATSTASSLSKYWKWIAVAVILFMGISYCSRTDRSDPPDTRSSSLSTPTGSGQPVSGVLLPDSASRPTVVKAPIDDEPPILEDGAFVASSSAAVSGVLLPETSPESTAPAVADPLAPAQTPASPASVAAPLVNTSPTTSATPPKYRPIDINSWYNKPHSNAYPESNEGYVRWFLSEDQSFSGIPFFIKNHGDDIVAFSPRDSVVSRSVQMSGRTIRAVHIIYGCGWCGTGTMATLRLTTLDDQVIEKRFALTEWSTGPNPIATHGSNRNSFPGNLYLASIVVDAKNAETLTIIDDASGPQLAIAALTIES